MNKTLLAAGTAAALVGLTACGGGADSAGGDGEYPMTVQNCGREVTIEQRPENVYVIGGEAGTIVHTAGGIDQVGTFTPLAGEPLGDAEDDLLAVQNQVPIQTTTDLSREVVIGAQPDLVVTYGLNDYTPEDLESAGIPTLILSGYCGGFGAGQSEVTDPLQGVYDDVRTVGRVLGTSDVAEQAATELEQRVDAVRTAAEQNPAAATTTMALFVIDADTPLGAYGRRSMVHQQMDYAGLENLFADTDERYFEPNTEVIIDAAPERFIALYEPGDTPEDQVADAVTSRPELADIPAVADENVLVLDFYYSGHGTLAVDGLEQLAEQIRE